MSLSKAPFTRQNLLSNQFDKLTTGCIVYTNIQSVVKAVWEPVERTAVRSTRLSNRVWQPFEWTVAVRSTWLSNRLTTRLTTGWMFVYMIQLAVKPGVQPFWQPVVSC